MKIDEFRGKLKGANREAVEAIAAELYKMIPKQRKDDEVDALIEGIIANGGPVKTPSKTRAKNEVVDFSTLKSEIETFCDNVDNGYYCTPNRIVSKQRRSKWRFEVKRFIKQLETVRPSDPNANEAARLYKEIYDRLAEGCTYYLFPTDDPFRSIGIRQGDFYPRLVARYFATGFTEDKIADMLKAATEVGIDRETLYSEMEYAFVTALKTPETREIGLNLAQQRVSELDDEIETTPSYDYNHYRLTSAQERLCEIVIGLGIRLHDGDKAVRYFMKHAKVSNKEIALYIALRTIDLYDGSTDLWIKTYESAIAKGITPRSELIECYQEKLNKQHDGNKAI